MNKENTLFALVGLLLGFIVGFMVANTLNQRGFGQPGTSSGDAASLTTDPAGASGADSAAAAMPQVQQAIDRAKNNPNDFDAQMTVGAMFYRIQRYDEAINYLTKAHQLKPDNYEALVQLGNAAFDWGKYEDAEKWYAEALQKKSDDVNVRTDLGLTYMFRAQPDYDRAIAEFRKSLQQNPKHEQTLQNLTVAFTKKGDAAQARQALEQLQSAAPQNPAIPQLKRDIDALGGGTQAAPSVQKIPTH